MKGPLILTIHIARKIKIFLSNGDKKVNDGIFYVFFLKMVFMIKY